MLGYSVIAFVMGELFVSLGIQACGATRERCNRLKKTKVISRAYRQTKAKQEREKVKLRKAVENMRRRRKNQ